MAADLHTHSEASADASVTIAERARLAREADLDAVAVTDHRAVSEWFDDREGTCDGVWMIAGVEINPCVGDHGEVHVLGLFVDPGAMREALEAGGTEWAYVDAIDAIHDAGGAAVMAHPGRYDVDLDAATAHLVERGLDGIEVEYPYAAYGALPGEVPYTAIDHIDALAEEYGLVRTGGSDCHGGEHEHMGAVAVPRERVARLRRAAERYR